MYKFLTNFVLNGQKIEIRMYESVKINGCKGETESSWSSYLTETNIEHKHLIQNKIFKGK